MTFLLYNTLRKFFMWFSPLLHSKSLLAHIQLCFCISFRFFCPVKLCKMAENIQMIEIHTQYQLIACCLFNLQQCWHRIQRIMFTVNYLHTCFEYHLSSHFSFNLLNFDGIHQDPQGYHRCFWYRLRSPLEQRLLKLKGEHIPLKFTNEKWLKCLKCCRWLSDLFPTVWTCFQGNLWQLVVTISLSCFFTCSPGLCMPQAHSAECCWQFLSCYIYE